MFDIKLFAGNATPVLAQRISDNLQVPLSQAIVGRFSDGEIMVEIKEHVRGRDTFILQSTCAPCNDNLMELIVMADALRRASANSITAVMPYFGYARQDRRVRSSRVPITAKVVADIIASVGITRIITVDLHADQIQGFFHLPVDNVYATSVIIADMQAKDYASPMVVSPDVGGVVRARAIAKRLNDTDLAIIDKRRPHHNQAQVMNVIGDVKGRNCIIVDDIIDTAGTLCKAAATLQEKGAASVVAYCTHPVLSGEAIANIEASCLDEVVVMDTIALSKDKTSHKIRQLSLSHIIAEAIHRIQHRESLSSMFAEDNE